MDRLTLLAFPQFWDGAGTLGLRVLALPVGDPFAPPFVSTDLAIEARLVSGLAKLPKPADPAVPVAFGDTARPLREELFNTLAGKFTIVPAAPPGPPVNRRVKKLLTRTYQAAAGITQSRTPFAVTDSSYRCAIEDKPKPAAQPPAPDPTVSWGQVMAYALRQPKLAEAMGLLYTADIPVGDAFAGGGWLYATLPAGSPFADIAVSYAARIPKLTATPRPVFASVLFPVTNAAAGGYDTVLAETSAYDDGFAKIVHAAQPISSGTIDTDPAHLPPVTDLGIRLGWDDEQLAVWLNRQMGLDPFTGAPSALDSRLVVAGYRIDVAEGGPWTTLNHVTGPVKVGDVDLGVFDGELSVAAVPVNLEAKHDGDFWLPPYLARWAGASVVLTDADAFRVSAQQARADNQAYTPVGLDIPLRYGHEYDFRVRLMDLSGGGPEPDRDTPADSHPAKIRFRRYVPPKAVTVVAGDPYRVLRPRLGYPDAVFTEVPNALDALLADRDAQLAALAADPNAPVREVSIPDPDVQWVEIALDVRGLDGDPAATEGFVRLYTTRRAFPGDPNAALDLPFQPVDIAHVSELPAPADDGPIPVPTAREVRLVLTALAKEDPQLDYFGTQQTRRSSVSIPVKLRLPAASENNLLVAQPESDQFRALFLQPDPAGILLRLAKQLGLEAGGLTLAGKAGRRAVFGCSAALRHAIGPDRASLTFGTAADLALHWIIATRVELDRDWTWQGAGSPSFEIERDGHGVVGTITLPRVVNRNALNGADREHTYLIFFDAIDPKPNPGDFPAELHEKYTLRVKYPDPVPGGQSEWEWNARLPVAARPTQTPRLVSAGLAASPYQASPDYSSTSERERRLWLEFAEAPVDKQDRLYARVLAYAPDSLLMASWEPPLADLPEPALPIDPEPVRVITPGQPQDDSGLDAMQELERADSDGLQYIVPLPPGMDEGSLELLGMFVYELRVGHDASRWSTAQARFGPPLRVAGVQHPAPPFACLAGRTPASVQAAALFATPVHDGRSVRPKPPKTDLWALLYAQVTQVDGASRRNILLTRRPALWQRPERENFDVVHGENLFDCGIAVFEQELIAGYLQALGLPLDSKLSVTMVELIGQPFAEQDQRPRQDPLGRFLGDMRILRSSTLTPVREICAVRAAP